MVSISVTIAASDISGYIKRIEIDRLLQNPIDAFNILVDNQSNRYGGSFSVQNVIDIKVDDVRLLKGYLDLIQPTAKSSEISKMEELISFAGRDFGQDLDNKLIDKMYPPMKADDAIDDILTIAGSEITFTSPSLAPLLSTFDSKFQQLISIIRDILTQVNWDGLVDSSKVWQMYAVGSVSTGITLKSVTGATDNNIRSIIKDEVDGTDIRNYIVVRGKEVEDGYSELNASDFTGVSGNVISDDTVEFDYGGASIKCEKGAGSECKLKLSLPKHNYSEWNLSKGELSVAYFMKDYDMPQNISRLMITLTDNAGNQIAHYTGIGPMNVPVGTPADWNRTSGALGPDVDITTGFGPWCFIGYTTSFNWEHVVSIEYSLPDNPSLFDVLRIDGLVLPVKMMAIAEDETSESLYGVRYMLVDRFDVETQVELDAIASTLLAQRKWPVTILRVRALGTAGLIGGNYKWIHGQTVNLNIPTLGINNVAYTIATVKDILEPDVEAGWDYIVDLLLILTTQNVDSWRLLTASNPALAASFITREKLRYVLNQDKRIRDWWNEPPKPIWELYGKIPHPGLDIDQYGANLVVNQSFEKDYDGDNIPDTWTNVNEIGTPSYGRSSGIHGAYCARIECDANEAGRYESDYFSIECSVKYFGACQTSQQNTNGKIALRIYWFKADKTSSSTAYSEIFFGNSEGGGWRRKTAQLTSPSDAYYAKASVSLGTDSGTVGANVAWFDDFQFKEVLYSPHEIDKIIDNAKIIDDASINPSKIRLSPTNTLDHWQRGEDGSYFDGERVYMNSIAAAKLGASLGTMLGNYHRQEIADTSAIEHSHGLAKGEGKHWSEDQYHVHFQALSDVKYKLTKCSFYLKCSALGMPTAFGRVMYSINGGSTWTQFGAEQETSGTTYYYFEVTDSLLVPANTELIVRFDLGGQNDDPFNTSMVYMNVVTVNELGGYGLRLDTP